MALPAEGRTAAVRKIAVTLPGEPTDEERRLRDEARAEAEPQPDAGLPWSQVRDGLLSG